MTTRQLRTLRGASAATVATLLAATSHTIAGGPAPAPLLVALMIALLTPVASGVVGPRASLARLAAAVALSQVAFHAAFQLLGSPTGDRVQADHAHHTAGVALDVAAPPAESAEMYAAHAVAAILTLALLWRGERVIRAIARETVAVLRRVEVPRAAAPVATGTRFLDVPRPVESRILSSVSLRGPPAPRSV
ncbi:hypothetical protein [Microbacterium sp. JZ31]|uniref:hypothetical protein n=1 Tax=Microbacterium sp. JZ31 TaxID=1906274 RepID=UPI0019321030|nr:hypothetical protein [Microbacterium sp. JZ31]